MARINSYGYYAPSTNKYSGGPYYGGRRGGDPVVGLWHLYGLSYPPPVPSNFTIEYYPTTSDETPLFMWYARPNEPEDLFFQIQLKYSENDFSSPDIDTGMIDADQMPIADWWAYALPIELRLVREGMYYARVRCTDLYTWSEWSMTLRFEFTKSAPPMPTIDPVTSPTDQLVQLICGSKVPDAYVFIRNNGGEWVEVEYTYGVEGTRWCYSMLLEPGPNYIEAVSSWAQTTQYAVSPPATAFIHTIFSEVEPYNVWNCFDELGMLVTLDRIKGEKNKAYKKRILDTYINPGNSTHQGLINAISRELGIDASGVFVYRLSDLADANASGNLLNEDGNAIGTKLEEYVKEVYDNNPIFWGNLIADESVWDAIDEEYTGVSYLPSQWDPSASGIYVKWQKAGIGDRYDLMVKKPKIFANPLGNVFGEPTGEGMMMASGVIVGDTLWRMPVHSGYFYTTDPSGLYNWR
jgi:hypothetical protein